jgi:hypothetical protein
LIVYRSVDHTYNLTYAAANEVRTRRQCAPACCRPGRHAARRGAADGGALADAYEIRAATAVIAALTATSGVPAWIHVYETETCGRSRLTRRDTDRKKILRPGVGSRGPPVVLLVEDPNLTLGSCSTKEEDRDDSGGQAQPDS